MVRGLTTMPRGLHARSPTSRERIGARHGNPGYFAKGAQIGRLARLGKPPARKISEGAKRRLRALPRSLRRDGGRRRGLPAKRPPRGLGVALQILRMLGP